MIIITHHQSVKSKVDYLVYENSPNRVLLSSFEILLCEPKDSIRCCDGVLKWFLSVQSEESSLSGPLGSPRLIRLTKIFLVYTADASVVVGFRKGRGGFKCYRIFG